MISKIDIKDWVTGEVIFSHECEDNTIRKTVEEAVKQDIRLDYADLSNADLSNANLSYIKLEHAKLFNANLEHANLFGASLFNASLFRANLNDINLEHAELIKAILDNADLSNAKLIRADLRNAYLINTSLRDADLRGAILNWAILDRADLSNTKIDYPMGLPDGEFIAWKKVNRKYIIKMKILEDSKRSRATTDKCRCDKALVLEIQNLDGSKSNLTEVVNEYYAPCTYKVGEIVEADSWDENRFKECSHGIHFFLNREIAVKYHFH